MKYLTLIVLLLLSACGGSDNISSAPTTPVPPPVTPPVSMVDAFFSAVMAVIGDGSETSTEPVATDNVVATAPEDSEPAPVK